MRGRSSALRDSVNRYCAEIGKNSMLVQGAGGNISWKEDGVLWIKASGAWLADALEQKIFVPVNLNLLQQAMDMGNFSILPRIEEKTTLRPSIETLLHALMPHPMVMHLHAVEVLTRLVCRDCETTFRALIDDSIEWAIVDYHKPGATLASAVRKVLDTRANIDVFFLKNHGVVIGGMDICQLDAILNKLITSLCSTTIKIHGPSNIAIEPASAPNYYLLEDRDIHQLALNPLFFNRLQRDWALYPDHVVFLGPKPHIYKTWDAFRDQVRLNDDRPELLFIEGKGVFARAAFNKAKVAQLRCYYDVLTRLGLEEPESLNDAQIADLLNWDAEQYRASIAK